MSTRFQRFAFCGLIVALYLYCFPFYEAKRIGISRGLSLWEAKKQCPELVVLPSDYESYSLFSKRMFDIIRQYTPVVEEASIDEGYADISGMRRVFRMSYEQIAQTIQREIHAQLGITVSIGLSITRGLAKLASDFQKPNGITAVPGIRIHQFLKQVPLGDVCGFGPNTVHLLKKFGLDSAYDFVMRPERWASRILNKPGTELWNELRGNAIYPVSTEPRSNKFSISKTKKTTTVTLSQQ